MCCPSMEIPGERRNRKIGFNFLEIINKPIIPIK
jgi:hypothetical protein